ncbi:hypothetical protein SAMD00024442_2_1 [Candidatus Symbiothrix dinenymphae]|nr:hypothetical protein SAMD00024442_2_1 [Candidatus Symbiothrix dinenymphae]
MKIDYNILWVEDNPSWYETTLELFKNTLEEDGFELKSERKSNIDEVKAMIANDGLQKYDMLLVDFTLNTSTSGDEVIKFIRDNKIYTDVLFYSSAVQNVTDSMLKYGLEGVYTADRKEIESKFEVVFKTTIKKIQHVNAIRGLIMGETSELDVEIEVIVMLLKNKQNTDEDKLKSYVNDKVVKPLQKRLDKFWENYGSFQEYFHKIDAVKKWEIFRELLKPLVNDNQEIATFLDANKLYQNEVIDLRNKFAHAKAEEKDGKMILKGQLGKEDFEFDETKCIEIRKNLIQHKKNIEQLKVLLSM